jgi:hypothetical protein
MKIKNIEPSLPNRDIYHLNKVWVDETLKTGVKIKKVEPSPVDYRRHYRIIDIVLDKGIKLI